jgi:hypothetical protein
MRETLKIMSMSRTAYTFSYFITQAVFCVISALLVSWGVSRGYHAPELIATSSTVLFGSVILFGFALISLAMALTTLFTDSKLSPQVGMYLLLLPTSIFFYVITNRMQEIGQEKSFGYKVFPLTYLMPNFSFSVIILEYFIKGGPKFLLGLDVTLAWWCLGLATPFYILLYMYLDGVIPNAYGIRENFCFCVRSRKARRDEEILRLDGLN